MINNFIWNNYKFMLVGIVCFSILFTTFLPEKTMRVFDFIMKATLVLTSIIILALAISHFLGLYSNIGLGFYIFAFFCGSMSYVVGISSEGNKNEF